MLNLRDVIGDRYKVTMTEEYRHGGDRDDENYMIVRGKRGDIVAWDDDTMEVTVYGVPLPVVPGVLPEHSHNLALPLKLERMGWKVKNHYDDSTCFILPSLRILEAIRYIRARKKRVVTEAMRLRGKALSGLKRVSDPQNASQ